MRVVFALVVFVLTGVCASAQSLNLYNIDTTGYPIIRADFTAAEANGRLYTGLTAADFKVVEKMSNNQLVDLSATVRQGCDESTADSAASIIIILDLSNSMSRLVNGITRFDIAKNALRQLVYQLNFSSGTQVCIIGFSSASRMICPWTGDEQALIDSINGATLGGGTNYESPFTGIPNMFDEFLKRSPAIPKMALFITDGRPSPPIFDPNAWVDSLTIMAFEQSIVLHSVSVDISTTYYPLEQLCMRTGGTSYVGSDAVLESMIKAASGAAIGRHTCFIEWESPRGCGPEGRLRTAMVTLLRDNQPADTVAYTSAQRSSNVIVSSTQLLEVGNPAPGSVSEASVTFTPISYDFQVRGFKMTPSTHFQVVDWDYPKGDINPPSLANPIVFRQGEPRTLRIRFKQDFTPAFRIADLLLTGDDCSVKQALHAGGTLAKVRLLTPNGGGVYSTCGDTVDIRWSGVPFELPVTLQWSDDGITWNEIVSGATGNLYRWVPTKQGVGLRVRVVYTPPGHYIWFQHIGHSGADSISSVAVVTDKSKSFVTGWFSGATQFGNGIVHNPLGAIDGFCEQLDTNGAMVSTYLLTGERGKNERIIGAVTDKAGNLYLAGTFESIAPMLSNGVDTLLLRMPLGQDPSAHDLSNVFLAKVSPLGVPMWVRYAQGLPGIVGNVYATKLGISETVAGQPQLVVAGLFEKFISTGISKSGKYLQLGPGLPLGTYYATFDKSGSPLDLVAGQPPTGFHYASKSATLFDGSQIEADHFVGTVSKEVFSVAAHSAATDAFVTLRGISQPVTDASDSTFVIRTPALTLDPQTLTMQATNVKTTSKTLFTQRLCNRDAYPTTITRETIDGANAKEFSLVRTLVGVTIPPNDCIDIEVQFKPSTNGARTASLHVYGSCSELATALLEGEGIRPCSIDVVDVVTFDAIVYGSTPSVTKCLVRNESSANISVSAHIEPAGSLFELTTGAPLTLVPNQCYTSTVTFDASTAAPGEYRAQIVYDVPTQCGLVSTDLVAIVSDTTVIVHDTNITIGSVDWRARRLGTTNDTVLYLANRGDVDVYVDSITSSDVSSTIRIDRTTLAFMPYLLVASDSIPVHVVYTPDTRSSQNIDVTAAIRGWKTVVKGLAKGQGILPAIAGTGDNWNPTTVLSVAAKKGSIVIRNTDPTTPLHIEHIEFVNDGQKDFRLLINPAALFPSSIAPNDAVTIPVEFIPQAVGARRELVRIYHDALPGPLPLTSYADTLVELVGIGVAGAPHDPCEFRSTLTCDTSIASFWLKNPSATEQFHIRESLKTDPEDVFEFMSDRVMSIDAGDSVELFVRFMPRLPKPYAATLQFTSTMGVDLYVTCMGEGTTTKLETAIETLQFGVPGNLVSVPVQVHPTEPFFTQTAQTRIEMQYAKKAMAYVSARIEPASVTITRVDASIPGRVAFDVEGSITNDITLVPTFRSLLAADTSVTITVNLAADYRCIVTDTTRSILTFMRPCAGSSRVVSLGTNAFAMAAPYPCPAVNDVTLRYSTGYSTSAVFEFVDAVGNVVDRLYVPAQPSAEYEVDVPIKSLTTGVYIVRMTSGHFTDSKILNVVR